MFDIAGMRLLLYVFTVLLSFLSGESDSSDIVTLRPGKPLASQMAESGVTYRINRNLDLKGDTLKVPEGCVLSFEGGVLCNGVLEGCNTEITGAAEQIFDNVSFTGTFDNEIVRSEWFRFRNGMADNRDVFDAMMALACSDCHTDVYIQKGVYYTSVGPHQKGIRIPDNTSVYNSAEIHALPSSLEKYDIISICNVKNVLFEGGQIYGDVGEHIGDSGEWGYGIGLTGARKCTIKDVYISRCWGDGINVQALYDDYLNQSTEGHCYDITIENVVCDDNRRQGMSIEGCIGISVLNSRFINTGKTQSTLPSAGIDIEPWFDTEVVSDVEISGCTFLENKGGGLICPLTLKQWENKRCSGFNVSDNEFGDNVVRFNRVRDLVFSNNEVGTGSGLLEFNQYSDIVIESNRVNGTVSVYTEGDSENGTFQDNVVKGGNRLSLAVDNIASNNIEGSISLSEGVACVVCDNVMNAMDLKPGIDYSLVCDNTSVEIYDNVFTICSPMIFRYGSYVDIHGNTFVAADSLHPACLILQTSRSKNNLYDGVINRNMIRGDAEIAVNYSENGKYLVDDRIL